MANGKRSEQKEELYKAKLKATNQQEQIQLIETTFLEFTWKHSEGYI